MLRPSSSRKQNIAFSHLLISWIIVFCFFIFIYLDKHTHAHTIQFCCCCCFFFFFFFVHKETTHAYTQRSQQWDTSYKSNIFSSGFSPLWATLAALIKILHQVYSVHACETRPCNTFCILCFNVQAAIPIGIRN